MTPVPERRNDIGTKVLIGVVATLVSLIMSASIVVASKAMERAQTNEIKITRLEAYQVNLVRDVDIIKTDVKTLVNRNR